MGEPKSRAVASLGYLSWDVTYPSTVVALNRQNRVEKVCVMQEFKMGFTTESANVLSAYC